MCRRMEPEERIADLEDRIEQLEREQQSDTDMTRRDALKTGAAALGLGGLIGGGAGAAATGTARAGTDQTGTWGSPGNPQDWYVEDLYDGDGNTVASAENGALNGSQLDYDVLNNVVHVGPGEDIQAAIDQVYSSNSPDASGVVRFDPSLGDEKKHQFGFDGVSLPVEIKEGVTLDVRGCQFLKGETQVAFKFHRATTVLAHGAQIFDNGGSVFWDFDGDVDSHPTGEAGEIYGFPQHQGNHVPVRMLATLNGNIGEVYAEITTYNNGDAVQFEATGGSGPFCNNNTVRAKGKLNPSASINSASVDFTGDTVAHNHVYIDQVQINGDGTGSLVRFDTGNNNLVEVTAADYEQNLSDLVEWTAGSGRHNKARTEVGYSPDDYGAYLTQNSGEVTNYLGFLNGTDTETISLGTDQSVASGDGWTAITFDTIEDSEFANYNTTTNTLTPEQTARYSVKMMVLVDPSVDQDTVQMRLQDADAATTRIKAHKTTSGTDWQSLTLIGEAELSGGNAHALEVNTNNGITVKGVPDETRSTVGLHNR